MGILFVLIGVLLLLNVLIGKGLYVDRNLLIKLLLVYVFFILKLKLKLKGGVYFVIWKKFIGVGVKKNDFEK